jgi:hypothetical protein
MAISFSPGKPIPIGTHYYDPHQRTHQIWSGNSWEIDLSAQAPPYSSLEPIVFGNLYFHKCTIPEDSTLYETIKCCVELSFLQIDPQSEADEDLVKKTLDRSPGTVAEYFKKDLEDLLKTPVIVNVMAFKDHLNCSIKLNVAIQIDQQFIDSFESSYNEDLIKTMLESHLVQEREL